MTACLLIDPFSGASGDMLLAAMIDTGAPIERLRDRVLAIPELSHVRVDVETVQRGVFAAKRLVVEIPHEHAHRGLSEITRIIDAAPTLSDRVKGHAKEAFTRLATAEAKVHGTSVEKVHFHEVGALDAILDVVGFFVLAEALEIDAFLYTNLVLGGGGTIRGAHGEMPVPAPATLELLAGHRVVYSARNEELFTPTAAAIVAAVFSPLAPESRLVHGRTGYGAGARESDGLPNVLRVALGRIAETPRQVAVVRCTIDDMSPEVYGHTMQELFEIGALEVYYTPVMMKKNRPGVEVTVIAEEDHVHRVGDYLLAHTTTLGVRVAREERLELERRHETIETELGPARVKVARLPHGGEKMSPEYESCREIAARTGLPVIEVFDAVKRAWYAEKPRR